MRLDYAGLDFNLHRFAQEYAAQDCIGNTELFDWAIQFHDLAKGEGEYWFEPEEFLGAAEAGKRFAAAVGEPGDAYSIKFAKSTG